MAGELDVETGDGCFDLRPRVGLEGELAVEGERDERGRHVAVHSLEDDADALVLVGKVVGGGEGVDGIVGKRVCACAARTTLSSWASDSRPPLMMRSGSIGR